MNVALHGLEKAIVKGCQRKGRNSERPIVIRYADDFVIFHSEEAKLLEAAEIAKEYLHGMGLELKPSKTKVTDTLSPYHAGQSHLNKGSGKIGSKTVWRSNGTAERIGPGKSFCLIKRPESRENEEA